MIVDSGSPVQRGHRNSLSLLHDVLGLIWEDVRAGSDSMAKGVFVAGGWNHLELSFTPTSGS